MTKGILAKVLTCGVLLGTIGVGSTIASADVTDDFNGTSEGTVSFEAPASGALKIVEVADLDFGLHEISAADETYKTETDTQATVSDLRGTLAGWKLTVEQGDQFVNGTAVLDNAQITLDTPKVSTGTGVAKTGIVLAPNGGAQEILGAKAGEGDGITTAALATGSASLSVPGATTKQVGTYSTELTWTLSDVPGNQ
ncbi:hypothetical protein D920_00236 [Enterococcus faecalis 13-SD-W-01]|nr:hypothetical protein D920_00236 [Enterococcus faecalis 13-SD-W-01]